MSARFRAFAVEVEAGPADDPRRELALVGVRIDLPAAGKLAAYGWTGRRITGEGCQMWELRSPDGRTHEESNLENVAHAIALNATKESK